MFECTGALGKCCKGHVNESSRHANSICSLSEEHQSLAGIKMRLLKLQQPFLLHNSPFTVQASAPEKPWPPTSLSTSWALCFKAMEIKINEKRDDILTPSLFNHVLDKDKPLHAILASQVYVLKSRFLSLWYLLCAHFSCLTQTFWNKTQEYFLSKYQLYQPYYLFLQGGLFKQYSTGSMKGHTLTC